MGCEHNISNRQYWQWNGSIEALSLNISIGYDLPPLWPGLGVAATERQKKEREKWPTAGSK
jgi:hypothetical protein